MPQTTTSSRSDPKEELFQQLLLASDPVTAAGLETALAIELTDYAGRLVWLKLRQHNPDIVQESVQRAITKRDTFRGDSKFSTWFAQIVYNECKMYLRQRTYDKQFAVSYEELSADAFQAAATQPIEDGIVIKDLLSGLTGEDLQLAEWILAGESYTDIGNRLGIDESAARKRWSRLTRGMRDGS